MKKTHFLRRTLLKCLQHLAGAALVTIVIFILLNSSVTIQFLDDEETYNLDLLGSSGSTFEESAMFKDMCRRQAEDIIKYCALKQEFENKGHFSLDKRIDVTGFVDWLGVNQNARVTAVYTVQDLIRWGKRGITYTQRTFSVPDFLYYFYKEPIPKLVPEGMEDKYALSEARMEELLNELLPGLEKYVDYRVDEDGIKTITFSMITCPYSTVSGVKDISALVNNWQDYFELRDNLAIAIERLSGDYDTYRDGQALYDTGYSNLRYMIRVQKDDKTLQLTNGTGLESYDDDMLTDLFSEHIEYLIYYTDTLEFTGMSEVEETDLSRILRQYSFAYPDATRIWMYVDTEYSVDFDSFATARNQYLLLQKRHHLLLTLLIVLSVTWLGLGIYLVQTAGLVETEEGYKPRPLSWIDKVWGEVYIAIMLLCMFAGRPIKLFLEKWADTLQQNPQLSDRFWMQAASRYFVYFVYGGIISFSITACIYSFARRCKHAKPFEYTLINQIVQLGLRLERSMVRHPNMVIHTLIPYNLFVVINLASAYLVTTHYHRHPYRSLFLLVGIVLLDALIGAFLFRNSAEKRDIIQGINRIRQGDVEYKIDLDNLNGVNSELAEAVNNIGEGIRKAVNTSMRDEQMKSDLITNVSHDLKTPLTSIISYVNLLKRQEITEEPTAGYIRTLDEKSERLKILLDDLLEASKISSGNLEIVLEKCNLTELMHQAIGEFEEKMEGKNLQMVYDEPPIAIINADGRRMWRIAENLFQNICKYAMPGTRVYVTLEIEEGKVNLSIKNISEKKSSFQGKELTERFIRGDVSRTTEGSGLGLFIAKSLTEAQGGEFDIRMDGDLFTAAMCFPEYGLEPVKEEVGEKEEAREKAEQ